MKKLNIPRQYSFGDPAKLIEMMYLFSSLNCNLCRYCSADCSKCHPRLINAETVSNRDIYLIFDIDQHATCLASESSLCVHS